MDNIFTVTKKPNKSFATKLNVFNEIEKSIICSVSCSNVIAFNTQCNIEEHNSLLFSSNVYICDLNSPWQIHKILCNSSPVTVLQWDFTGELLLIGDENGCIRIYKIKDHILNDWNLLLQTVFPGEHILAAAFFHPGKKVCLNTEKKDCSSYLEKFQHVKFACSVKQFGGRPANGALLLTTTGMLAAVLLPQNASQSGMVITTESLGPTRIFIKTADICYGKNGHFLVAVSSGDSSMPIQCYKVSVIKVEEKCIIASQSLLSFFLFEAPKEVLFEQIAKDRKCTVSHLKWIMREDADSLVVAANGEKMSCLQVWELREKALPIHKSFGNSESAQFFNTLWQYQCHFQYNHKVTALTTSKLSLINSISCGYIVVTFADNTIHCLYRDTLKPIVSTTLSTVHRYNEEPLGKFPRTSAKICSIDTSWLGNVLLVVDSDDGLHLFKLPPQIESSATLSVPYCTTILEYCLICGLDCLDLLLIVRPSMLEAISERLIESFNRQTAPVQQFFYLQYLCIKTSLYRLSANGQSRANDLTHFLMLHSISTAFKSLLRPSEMNSHEKSPADSLAAVISEGQTDVDKVLMHLEAKEFTVEPSTLQSLQQLIQWIADLTLNLLIKLPETRPSIGKSYELIKDLKALNILREMLVLIRVWGLLRPACLPVFIKSDATLDILALLFRLLGRLMQNVNEPDDALIDDCCLLPNQVQVQPMQQINNRTVLASPQLAQQTFPLQLKYNSEPDCLISNSESTGGQTIDSIRHLFLGKTPRVVKHCVRCTGSAGTTHVTRTAAIRAWDQRWLRSCQCGGLWRVQVFS
ncbi:mediator of RNA polymerase II transcription subunit 16 isoform X2 [Cylas formicarius]|uniref:mediator of RNA polymerase II transcription subunit 16 isoform X2 n=1 Tax=Cylas formicarius TaxID=197179 RepID=UPI002958A0FC|nr:mediator of RNA polymerase II transcription subunit 16 isoform X2 [Cylas formicarius]